jgi:hypothetical protein
MAMLIFGIFREARKRKFGVKTTPSVLKYKAL